MLSRITSGDCLARVVIFDLVDPPAAVARMSALPNSSTTEAKQLRTASKSLTSQTKAFAAPPAFTISSATLPAVSAEKSTTATFAPPAARRFAIAPPIFPPAPVTIAVMFSNFIASSVKVNCTLSESTCGASVRSRNRTDFRLPRGRMNRNPSPSDRTARSFLEVLSRSGKNCKPCSRSRA